MFRTQFHKFRKSRKMEMSQRERRDREGEGEREKRERERKVSKTEAIKQARLPII